MVVWIHNVQQLTRAYVDRVLVPYAQEIAEAAVEEMPQYSWGPAVAIRCVLRCVLDMDTNKNH